MPTTVPTRDDADVTRLRDLGRVAIVKILVGKFKVVSRFDSEPKMAALQAAMQTLAKTMEDIYILNFSDFFWQKAAEKRITAATRKLLPNPSAAGNGEPNILQRLEQIVTQVPVSANNVENLRTILVLLLAFQERNYQKQHEQDTNSGTRSDTWVYQKMVNTQGLTYAKVADFFQPLVDKLTTAIARYYRPVAEVEAANTANVAVEAVNTSFATPAVVTRKARP